ncbi:MAG TPA: hypothetical protein PKD55_03400 [Bellilinea sp.]|nr:hypothetical protein [Bellilinea sp.]
MDPIHAALTDLEHFIESFLPGEGAGWLRRNLSHMTLSVGGFPHWIVTRLTRKSMTVVFPQRSIWFADTFTSMEHPEHHIVHELAHAIDNSLSERLLPATLFGGGPADKLIRSLGGNPAGLRVGNPFSVPSGYRWSEKVNGGYGNSSTAEYFAESLCWTIYNPALLPSLHIGDHLRQILLDYQIR